MLSSLKTLSFSYCCYYDFIPTLLLLRETRQTPIYKETLALKEPQLNNLFN